MIYCGNFKNIKYIYDVESGSLHVCDDISFSVTQKISPDFSNIMQVVDELPFPKNEILSAIFELAKLRDDGTFYCEQLPTPTFPEPAVKSLCLNVAHACDLDCAYCFAQKGSFGGRAELMSAEVGKTALDMLIRTSGERNSLEVDFFGGEPLLNFEIVREIVEYGRQLEQKFSKTIRFTLTTNANNVTDEMANFLNNEMSNLVISIDGRQRIHDAVRPDKAGNPTWKNVVACAKKLTENRTGEYYIRGTYTAKNLDFPSDVAELSKLGFAHLSLEPVVCGGELAITESDLPKIKQEYDKLADFCLENDIDFFHFNIDFSGGPCVSKRLRGCGAGFEYLAASPDGTLYPCHQFVGKDEFAMGDVAHGVTKPEIGEKFRKISVLTKPECQGCFAKYICSGGCAAEAFRVHGDLEKPDPLFCEIMKKRVELAIGMYLYENLRLPK